MHSRNHMFTLPWSIFMGLDSNLSLLVSSCWTPASADIHLFHILIYVSICFEICTFGCILKCYDFNIYCVTNTIVRNTPVAWHSELHKTAETFILHCSTILFQKLLSRLMLDFNAFNSFCINYYLYYKYFL